MTGATAGAASTFAGSDTSERRSKYSAMSGAVPSVAAIVTASASARPRGMPAAPSRVRSAGTSASSASTAAKLSCQPGSAAACGLQASVSAAASSSAYQRDAGRPASAATRPADAHHGRALDRGAGARERHVGGDERDRQPQPRAQPEAGRGAEREHERRQQDHVRAAGGDEVRQARRAEVLAHIVGQRAVLPEHHAAGERALRCGHAAR